MSNWRWSLQDMCFKIIAKNFETLLKVHEDFPGIIPPEYFVFLKRNYTGRLFKSITTSGRINQQCLMFLMNEHLKTLDLTRTKGIYTDAITEQLKLVGKTITTLDLRYYIFNDAHQCSFLASVPNLEVLYLGKNATDIVLKCVGQHCFSLHTLDASENKVTIEGVKYLCKKDESGKLSENKILKNLYIYTAELNDDDLQFILTYFPSLEELAHWRVGLAIYNIYQKCIWYSSSNELKTYNLKKLNLRFMYFYIQFWLKNSVEQPPLSDVLYSCSILCPKVSCVIVSDSCSQDNILTCSAFQQLTKITIVNEFDSIDYNPFIKVKGVNLTVIELHGGTVSLELLSNCCINLTHLLLQSMEMESKTELKSLNFPKLKLLQIGNMKLLEEKKISATDLIHSSPLLRVLLLTECQHVTDEFVESVINSDCFNTLKVIDLSISDVTVSAVQKLVTGIITLKELYIMDCKISDSEARDLEKYYYIQVVRECYFPPADKLVSSYICDIYAGDHKIL